MGQFAFASNDGYIASDSRSLPTKLTISVLVVDDEPEVGSAIQALLHRDPYNVHTVTSPSEAWYFLEHHVIDVLLSDENMPEFNGSTLLALVREFYPLIGRILMTGQNDLCTVVDALNRRNANQVLLKPYKKDELIHAINCACEADE